MRKGTIKESLEKKKKQEKMSKYKKNPKLSYRFLSLTATTRTGMTATVPVVRQTSAERGRRCVGRSRSSERSSCNNWLR
jgi:hypothetical protein